MGIKFKLNGKNISPPVGLEEKTVDVVFEIAATTPFPVNDILDFMALTGIKIKETKVLMNSFSQCGISDLKDVNTLVKMGHFNH